MLKLSLIFLGLFALAVTITLASELPDGPRISVESCTGAVPGFGAEFNSLQFDFCPETQPATHCQRFANMPVDYTFTFSTNTDLEHLRLVASYKEGTTQTIVSVWTSSLGWKNNTQVVVRQSLAFAEGTQGNKTVEFLLTSPKASGSDLELCRSATIEVMPVPNNFQHQGSKVGDVCPLESVGGPCIFEKSVCDLNLAGTSGECRMGAGHVSSEVPPPTNDGEKFGDYCYTINAPCAFPGSICVPSPSPYLGFCECNKGFTYEERTRNGLDVSGCKSGPQSRCADTDDCVSGAHCLIENGIGSCTCWPGFYEVEHQCIRLGGGKIGDSCNVNGAQCNFPYSTCLGGSCGCNPVAIEQYDKCKIPHKRQCISHGDCVAFADCIDGTCRCIEGKKEVDDGTCAGAALVVTPVLVLAGIVVKFFIA